MSLPKTLYLKSVRLSKERIFTLSEGVDSRLMDKESGGVADGI
jgi:hypothetical protein